MSQCQTGDAGKQEGWERFKKPENKNSKVAVPDRDKWRDVIIMAA